ncbi:hypothetical protein [Actinomadura meyerae]|uniref:hypothetical protein n=1 Tax=Actinomadura meyerae TaxID=240840 RepID=UPI000B78B425|nr:hypothetical protein [Actinomadura meyerae]
MSSTLTKFTASWTDARPGTSVLCASVRGTSSSRLAMPGAYAQAWQRDEQRANQRGEQRANLRGLRDLRFEQLIQDDQGRSVFELLVEDASVPAPATAHMGATKGGVSGPYPWRRPV